MAKRVLPKRWRPGPNVIVQGRAEWCLLAQCEGIRLILPRPGPALSPNARTHWTRKAHCTQKYRWLVGQLARPLAREKRLRVPWDKATVSLTFYQPNDLRRDADNFLASMKAAFDGLVDAGILKDDNRITHLPVEMKLDRKNPRVEMLVTPRM